MTFAHLRRTLLAPTTNIINLFLLRTDACR